MATATASYQSQFPYQAATVPGAGVYGGIPQQIAMPPSTYTQALAAQPSIGPNMASAGNLIGDELAGRLTPAMQDTLQDKSASWGPSSGMGFGSGLGQDKWDTSRLLSTIGYQNQGLSNALNYNTNVEGGMLDPSLMANIAGQNSVWAASPDPTMEADAMRNAAAKKARGQMWQSIGGMAGSAIGAAI
jgi:hypothetical protein